MALQLSTIIALPEDPASVPSTHMMSHNHPYLQIPGDTTGM